MQGASSHDPGQGVQDSWKRFVCLAGALALGLTAGAAAADDGYRLVHSLKYDPFGQIAVYWPQMPTGYAPKRDPGLWELYEQTAAAQLALTPSRSA